MLDSGYDHPWVILKDRASGYEKKDGQTVNAMLMQMDTPFGGGSMYSTVGDLLLWDQALYTDKLVSRKSLEQMFTPYEGAYPAVRRWEQGLYSRHRYGYGWFVTKWFGRDLIWHDGEADLKMEPMTVANGLSAISFGLEVDSSPITAINPEATRKK